MRCRCLVAALPASTFGVLPALLLGVMLVGPTTARADDHLVLQAPNRLGQTGVVRVTSAQSGATGQASLGLFSRLFVSPDFAIPDIADGATFLESNAVVGVSLFEHLELSLAARGGAVLDSARAQPATSFGDLAFGLKGGASFGLLAVGAHANVDLPTRTNKVGFALDNLGAGGDVLVTADLLSVDVPLRLHFNAGYQLQLAHLSDNTSSNPLLLDGPDGALVALAADQWFYDQVRAGLAAEVPLPFITPFLEVWYQAALGAPDYGFFGDAHLTLTPGIRIGLGGLRVDLAADVGLSGTAGGAAIDPAAIVDGQPINPLWAGRVAVSHQFDFLGGGGGGGSGSGGGGGGSYARVEGCAKDGVGPVTGAVAALTIDGQPGPSLLTDSNGCFSVPVKAGAVVVAWQARQHQPAQSTVEASRGDTARVDVVLTAAPASGHIVGFVTNTDDESIKASLQVQDAGGLRDAGESENGAFDLEVRAGEVLVFARAQGYLAQGVYLGVDADVRRTHTFVMRKVPKKRSATLKKEEIATTTRLPFVFKSERPQSTAQYLLEEIADLMIQNPELRISIEAHTDPSEASDPSEAKALTLGRARAVKDALVALGIAPSRLETAGKGITELVGKPNDPKNRRVEFLVVP